MLGSDDLVLCAGTMMNASFQDHLAAAVAGGFQAVSLYPTEIERARSEGLRDADLRRMLADHGLALAELDPLLTWASAPLGEGASAEGSAMFQTSEDDFYTLSEALGGARSINAALFTDEVIDTERLAEAFAGLCDRAARHDLLIHLEYLPWTQIPDLPTARRIVELADRPNGGLMIDSWHHFRSQSSVESIRDTPGNRILAVQLNDAPLEPGENLIVETLHARRLPGAGDIDLAGIVAAIRDSGSQAPIGVEVFSDELAKLSPEDLGRQTGAATRAALGR